MAEKTASLTVLGGPLAGTRCVLPETGTVTIGSAPDSTLQLDLPTVSPFHARIEVEAGRVTVHDTGAEPGAPRQRQPPRARRHRPPERRHPLAGGAGRGRRGDAAVHPAAPARRGALPGHPARDAGAAAVPAGPRDAHARGRDPGALVLRRGALPGARAARGGRARARGADGERGDDGDPPGGVRRRRDAGPVPRRRGGLGAGGGSTGEPAPADEGLVFAEPSLPGATEEEMVAAVEVPATRSPAPVSSRTPRPSWSKRPRSTSRRHPRS